MTAPPTWLRCVGRPSPDAPPAGGSMPAGPRSIQAGPASFQAAPERTSAALLCCLPVTCSHACNRSSQPRFLTSCATLISQARAVAVRAWSVTGVARNLSVPRARCGPSETSTGPLPAGRKRRISTRMSGGPVANDRRTTEPALPGVAASNDPESDPEFAAHAWNFAATNFAASPAGRSEEFRARVSGVGLVRRLVEGRKHGDGQRGGVLFSSPVPTPNPSRYDHARHSFCSATRR